ncbi:hypothetical protein CI238_00149 [Colletotrichum incanum]|uniref:Uncharacterized protein n=1 Tax=Colletotrichum incanum TaxID=1573173 RepID=A0A166QYK7_COLIC|nr:hypothetical protein CI238_00149 [Colletotrichum incanum]
MLILSLVAKSTTSRGRIRVEHGSLGCTFSIRQLTCCRRLCGAEAADDHEPHATSHTLTTTGEDNESRSKIVTNKVKEYNTPQKTPEATVWGSFAGNPFRPRPIAGAPGVKNGPNGSISQTKAMRTPVTPPRKQENGKWGMFYSQQVQGPALDPKVRRKQRQRGLRGPPKYAPAPRWSPDDLPSGQSTERWGASNVLQNLGNPKHRRLGAGSSVTRTAERDEAAANDALETPSLLADDTLGEGQGSTAETAAPENPRKPAQPPGVQKWGGFNWQWRTALTCGGGEGSARRHLEQRETDASRAKDGTKPEERCNDTSQDRPLLTLLERKATSTLGMNSGSLVRGAETKTQAQGKPGIAPDFFTGRDIVTRIQRDQARTQNAPTMIEPTELHSGNTSLLSTREEFISLMRGVDTEKPPITATFRSKTRSSKSEDRATVLTKEEVVAFIHGTQDLGMQATQRGRSRRGRRNGPAKDKSEDIPKQDKPPAYPASHATTRYERKGKRDINTPTKEGFAFLSQGNETSKQPFAKPSTDVLTKAEVLSYLQVPEASPLLKHSGTRKHQEKHTSRDEPKHNRPEKRLSKSAVNRNQQSIGSTGSPSIHEEIERHFRKSRSTNFERFSDKHSANDLSQRTTGDYVRDWPSWIEMLLTTQDTPSVRSGDCSLCLRHTTGITRHHVYPRGVTSRLPHWFTWRQRNRILELCQPCHIGLHHVFNNALLAMKYHSVDRIVSEPLIKSWLSFAQHHSVEDMRQLMLPRTRAAHILADAGFMAAVETALDRIWTENLFPSEHILGGDRRRALRAAVRKAGAPQNTFVEHIQRVMQKRPEWASWYRYVFLTGNKHEQRKLFRNKSRRLRRGR